MTPIVSICIPTYNGARWLQECLDSALACTASCEILVVDDGSSDETVALAKSAAQQDTRVRVFINEKNLGLVGNWNRCLELAKGEWIKFLFQDDVLGPRAIETMLEAAREEDRLLAVHRHYVFGENTSEEARQYYTKEVLTLDKLAPGGQLYSAQQVVAIAAAHPAINFIGEPSTVMFRRRMVSELGVFDAHLKQLCDLEYALRVASKYGLHYVLQARVDFRVHGGSVTAQNTGARKFESTYLDPVRLVSAQLFAPEYAAFRGQLSSSDKKRLQLWLRMRVYEAKRAAADTASQEQLQQLFADYPPLRKLAGKLLNRVLYGLLQLRRR